MCIATIGLEAMAALQLAQPSLGKMAVSQPLCAYIPRLAENVGGGENVSRCQSVSCEIDCPPAG